MLLLVRLSRTEMFAHDQFIFPETVVQVIVTEMDSVGSIKSEVTRCPIKLKLTQNVRC